MKLTGFEKAVALAGAVVDAARFVEIGLGIHSSSWPWWTANSGASAARDITIVAAVRFASDDRAIDDIGSPSRQTIFFSRGGEPTRIRGHAIECVADQSESFAPGGAPHAAVGIVRKDGCLAFFPDLGVFQRAFLVGCPTHHSSNGWAPSFRLRWATAWGSGHGSWSFHGPGFIVSTLVFTTGIDEFRRISIVGSGDASSAAESCFRVDASGQGVDGGVIDAFFDVAFLSSAGSISGACPHGYDEQYLQTGWK